MKITTDLTGTESAATRHARLKAIYDWYFGTGAYVAAGNLGVARAALNGLLPSDIANGETFSSWLVKANWLNDLDTAIPALIYTGGYKGFTIDAEVLSSMSQDTAGATPVTAAGQSVGRILDRSGNAMHPTQATAAQKPTYQVDGSGQPLLRFDGVDDWMVTPTVLWGADEVTIVAAIRKASDAAEGWLAHSGVVGDNGSWQIGMPGGGADKAFMISRGTVQAAAATSSVTYAAPISMVVTASGDVSGDTVNLRLNGTQVGNVVTDQGTGNYLDRPVHIGRRLGATLPFNGDIYAMLTVNRMLTTQQRGWVEKWMALKPRVTLP